MNFIDKVCEFVKKYMTIMVLIAAIVAYIKPETFIWAVPHMNTLLGLIMFGMGMTLKKEDFELVIKRPKDILFGTLVQFTVMPIGAYVCAKIFGLSPELAIGLILLGCCPGGVTSNVMSFIAKGDVALSVTYTTVATLISPIVTPAYILLLGGQWLEVSASAMFLSIVKVVLVPIILGFICHRFFNKFAEASIRVLPALSGSTMVLLVGGIVSANVDNLATSGIVMAIAVIIHNVVGYVAGYYAAKKIGFSEDKRRVVSIETGMQNATLATTLAMTHFGPMAAIAPAIAGIWHAFSVAFLANYWSKKEIVEDEIKPILVENN